MFLGKVKWIWGGKKMKTHVSGKTHTKQQLDNYANQNNPNNAAYKANRDNHANQCNKNNKSYKGKK